MVRFDFHAWGTGVFYSLSWAHSKGSNTMKLDKPVRDFCRHFSSYFLAFFLAFGDRTRARYNHAMRPRTADQSSSFLLMSLPISLGIPALIMALTFASACTFYGERPARTMAEATGGEGLERIFWKNVQSANWIEVERAIASNYSGVGAAGTLDRSAALDQYRSWQLKDFAIGDLKTELNGSTVVVTYTMTLNGVLSNGAGHLQQASQQSSLQPLQQPAQQLPSAPQHMMTVWQQQKKGWVVIAHSVSTQ
jgi:hypothetical protein